LEWRAGLRRGRFDGGRRPRILERSGTMMTAARIERLTAAIVSAWTGGPRLDGQAAEMIPADLAEAYAVQSAVLRRRGEAIGGRKVAIRNGSGVGALLARERMTGRGGRFPFVPGLALELEIALVFGAPLVRPAGRGLMRSDVLACVSGVSAGIEIVGARFDAPSAAPFTAFVADGMANAGFAAGPVAATSALEAALAGRATLAIGGAIAFDGPVRHPFGDPVAAILAYAATLPETIAPIAAGEIVTTGSLCGLVAVTCPARIEGTITGLGPVAFDLAAAGAQ